MLIHIDMDAFYASVEQLDHPELRGLPVIVGMSARGVVAAASYEARKFGVRSAMPVFMAKERCPMGVFLPVRMERYEEISAAIHEIFNRYTPIVEPIALDEAFIDASGSERLFGSSVEIARRIKQDIRDELGLSSSAGVGPNKFVAKMASEFEKPDGFTVVREDQVQEFLDPQPISDMWGVGRAYLKVFDRLGVATIRDLRLLSKESLRSHFGEAATESLWHLSRGLDTQKVIPEVPPKSMSHSKTLNAKTSDLEVLSGQLLELTDKVAQRLRASKLFAKSVHLYVRFSDFSSITRMHTLGFPTDVTDDLARSAVNLLHTRLPSSHLPIRALGVSVDHLVSEEAVQLFLFDIHDHDRQVKLDLATDRIRDRFGRNSLKRASSL